MILPTRKLSDGTTLSFQQQGRDVVIRAVPTNSTISQEIGRVLGGGLQFPIFPPSINLSTEALLVLADMIEEYNG